MSMVGFLLGGVAFLSLNMGVTLGLTFAALILLRPVTNRLIAPKYRVWIWFVGWYCGFLMQIYAWIGKISFLPVSFRSLIAPRTFPFNGVDGVPGFLPLVQGAGDYAIALPGGAEIPFHISDIFLVGVGLLWLGMWIAALVWDARQGRRLKQIGRQGTVMNEDQRAKFSIDRDNVVVRLCNDLPTSFVRFGNDDHMGDGTRFVICIQDNLPEERMRLVLLHEMEHLKQHHAWWKSTITIVLYLFFWNPILWVAYRLTCRDMELACDEAVMEQLSADDRREYARTLVELGVGKPMWGAMTSFGECDAALRIRRVASWKRRSRLNHIGSIFLTLVLVLFFYCGSLNSAYVQTRTQDLNWTWYANGTHFELDFKAKYEDLYQTGSAEIMEIWERKDTRFCDEHSLVVRDRNGVWYSCCCAHEGEDSYAISSLQKLPCEPDLEEYHGIVITVNNIK